MGGALGDGYARVWAEQTVLAGLDGRTVRQALDDGEAFKRVWEAVWAALELPLSLR